MANRPGTLCNLKPGKALGAQANFAATFNWLVAAVRNLRGGKGVKVSWPADDTPEIATDGEDGGEGEGGGDGTTVAFTGTDQSQTIRGTDFTFASATYSNVVVTCYDDVIKLGVYYT